MPFLIDFKLNQNMPSTPLTVMYFLIILHKFNNAFTVQDCKHEKENHIGNKFPYLLKYSCDRKNYQCSACLYNVHGLVFLRSAKDINNQSLFASCRCLYIPYSWHDEENLFPIKENCRPITYNETMILTFEQEN